MMASDMTMRRRHHVADPLREFADGITDDLDADTYWMRDELYRIADQIDREHERRMEQQAYDLRKAFCRYMGGVLDDYRHGMKRKRLRK